ncbi:cystathionine gamma-lyase [Rhodococcus artemisiae]|uniref:Cystathionine gamma-lyase n=1 Tax=Rhodococcus artemisiae TaxID=714159 RepID=A0ABU7L860_9NOCA|nr:cystathionine gamma-lyase [Rhodococcus artemisiae]MEE2057715.1 cystathionine gamma-lyase [Rhodococcus artemisiae]
MLGDSTRCVEAVAVEGVPGDPLQRGPVFAAPYRLGEDELTESDTYARASNPGWRDLERALATLEDASAARVVGSGMSAITVALRALAGPGGVVVVPSDGYYQVRMYARDCLEPFGAVVHELSVPEFGDGTLGTVLADAPEGAVVLVETPSNPGLDTVDLAATAATCRAAGALLLVDNTTATPLGQQPLCLGADVVVASGTKSLSGHSDLLFGYLAVRDDTLLPRIDRERLLSGTVLGPFETWLAHRSLGTAGLRFERQCANAQAIAQMLAEHPAVAGVRYPGLPTDPAHPVAAAQMRRFGPLVTFRLDNADRFHRFVRSSELVVSATSFGGIHTTADRRARWGDQVAPGFVRLSCGIEDTDDLLADLDAALHTS